MLTGVPPPATPGKSHATRDLTIGVLFVLIAAAAYVELISHGGSGGGGLLASSHTINIVNGLITVNAGSYEYYPISVPSGATSVFVQGSFTASGGSGNDILVLVLDATSFTNWQNGHSVNTYYNSGQLTTSTINAALPSGSGSYYLVYSNTFSTFSQKNVNTKVNLVYSA